MYIQREVTMNRVINIFSLICVCILFGCQSKAIQMLVQQQEWENLAVTTGVTCSSPEMVDGNHKSYGEVQGRWIHLRLPARKSIHRIIIRGTNITDAMVYKQLENDKRWQVIQQIQNNRKPDIEIRKSFITQALRIYIGGTTNDQRKSPKFSERYGAIVSKTAIGKTIVHELEVYGFVSKE